VKRAEIQRKTPMPPPTSGLRRSTPLQQQAGRESLSARQSPLKRSSIAKSAPKSKLTTVQKRPLLERSEGVCEIGTAYCAHFATDVCHRRGEKAGGRHGDAAVLNDRLSNVLHGCRTCHNFTGQWPKTAELNGWRLTELADPLAERVNRRGRFVFLDDEGGVFDASTRDRVA
jgi:hypothetical protein